MLAKLMRRKDTKKKNIKLNHEIENANEKMCIYGYGYCHIEGWGWGHNGIRGHSFLCINFGELE